MSEEGRTVTGSEQVCVEGVLGRRSKDKTEVHPRRRRTLYSGLGAAGVDGEGLSGTRPVHLRRVWMERG